MAHAACGFYGKIPIRADFVRGRLRPATIQCWDAWMQEALLASQAELGVAWRDLFFSAPIWRFLLPAGICGEATLVGVMMPSIDAVGRCFPLLLAHEFEHEVDPFSLVSAGGRWFASLERLALDALSDEFRLANFDQALPLPERAGLKLMGGWPVLDGAGPGAWLSLSEGSGIAAALTRLAGAPTRTPSRPPALWWTSGGSEMAPGLVISRGLIPPRNFPACLDGRWQSHGWPVIGLPQSPSEAATPEWDR